MREKTKDWISKAFGIMLFLTICALVVYAGYIALQKTLAAAKECPNCTVMNYESNESVTTMLLASFITILAISLTLTFWAFMPDIKDTIRRTKP